MNLLLPILIVAAVGLISGLGLAFASKVMEVPSNEGAEEIEALLPGVSCGACGYAGCAGYAEALSAGDTRNVALCAPGGNETAEALAELTGFEAGSPIPAAAVVLCRGNHASAELKHGYAGARSCKMAVQLFGGAKECGFGCIGYGDCAAVCPYNAVRICDGVAHIDPAQCRACGMCIKECPKNIIALLPLDTARAAVLCVSQDKRTKSLCSSGCTGCMRCKKVCECDAVTVENFCARIDGKKCIACGKCIEVCPAKCVAFVGL